MGGGASTQKAKNKKVYEKEHEEKIKSTEGEVAFSNGTHAHADAEREAEVFVPDTEPVAYIVMDIRVTLAGYHSALANGDGSDVDEE